MPHMPQYQVDAVEVLRARLDPSHPGFKGSDEVRAALEGPMMYYMADTLALLDVIEGNAPKWQRDYVKSDANAARRKRLKAPESTMCGASAEGHRSGNCTLAKDHGGSHWFPNMWNDM